MERVGVYIRGTITLAVILLATWWLVEVARRIGVPPTKGPDGNVVVDGFQQAKDILLVVLPLTTTAFGYWFGAKGAEKAEKDADSAKREFAAVVATSPDPDLLKNAKNKYPEEFSRS